MLTSSQGIQSIDFPIIFATLACRRVSLPVDVYLDYIFMLYLYSSTCSYSVLYKILVNTMEMRIKNREDEGKGSYR